MRPEKFFQRISSNWPVKILSITAAVLLFLFNQMASLEERFISVPLQILVSEQFLPAESYPRTVRLTLRGKSEEVNLVLEDDIEVVADFSRYEHEGSYTVPIQIRKKGSLAHMDPLELQVEPQKLSLKIEKKLSKSVRVEPSITGYPAKGFELSQFFLTPSSVEVEGLESTLSVIDSVETEPIDISGRKEDFTLRLRLKRPDPYSRFPGGDTVEFFGIIQENTILKTIENIDLIVLDLNEDLVVEGLPEGAYLTVQGPQLPLETLNREDFMLTIDCSRIKGEGIYELPVKPEVPRGVLVLKYSPVNVSIRVEEDGGTEPWAEELPETGTEEGAR